MKQEGLLCLGNGLDVIHDHLNLHQSSPLLHPQPTKPVIPVKSKARGVGVVDMTG